MWILPLYSPIQSIIVFRTIYNCCAKYPLADMVDPNESILWSEGIVVDDDLPLVSIPHYVVTVGSRFEGVEISATPEWLGAFARQNIILNINGTIHFYTGVEGGWYPLRSTVTLGVICQKLGLHAPVNFAKAVEPYVALVETMPWPTVVVANTFTQGRLRYGYTINMASGVVEFVPNRIDGNPPTAKNTLCTIPVSNVNPVLRLNLSYSSAKASRHNAMGWLYDVFGDNIITLLWALGDMLYDSSNKHLFILYGPGGVGKSTVANILGGVIGGTVPTIASHSIALNPRSFSRHNISASQLIAAASSRLVNVPDVEARAGDELNMQNIKALTGGDEVDGMKVSTTLIMTVNTLFKYENQSEYTRPDRVRRVVVIPTVAKRLKSDSESTPLHQSSIDELVQFAIRTRIKHRKPPLKTDALLATLFQGGYRDVLEIVYIDCSAGLWECMTATLLICWRFGIELEDLSHCLEMVGCSCYVKCGKICFIAHVKPLVGHSIQHLYPPQTSESKPLWNRSHCVPASQKRLIGV